ncbi:MAG: T9SS type A sorting domain-containing protein [bacterium]
MFWQNTHIYTRSSQYGFYKTFYEEIDSTAFLSARFIDIDFDLKVNIITPVVRVGLNFATLVDYEQQGTIGIGNNVSEIPHSFSLYQNYPNPFNSQTRIKFDIKKSDINTIRIYDIRGKEIETLLNQYIVSDSYEIEYNANILSSGVYFYKLSSSINSQTRKLLLIK